MVPKQKVTIHSIELQILITVQCHQMNIQLQIGNIFFFSSNRTQFQIGVFTRHTKKNDFVPFLCSYYARTYEFSKALAKSGMYRNHSLNTVMDKSHV